jgi:hypothetical protein
VLGNGGQVLRTRTLQEKVQAVSAASHSPQVTGQSSASHKDRRVALEKHEQQ